MPPGIAGQIAPPESLAQLQRIDRGKPTVKLQRWIITAEIEQTVEGAFDVEDIPTAGPEDVIDDERVLLHRKLFEFQDIIVYAYGAMQGAFDDGIITAPLYYLTATCCDCASFKN